MGRNERAFAIPLLSGIIGVVFAIVTQLLYEAGIVFDELITGSVSLREIQMVIILTWVCFGVIMASLQR